MELHGDRITPKAFIHLFNVIIFLLLLKDEQKQERIVTDLICMRQERADDSCPWEWRTGEDLVTQTK